MQVELAGLSGDQRRAVAGPYILADAVVAPPGHESLFSPKISCACPAAISPPPMIRCSAAPARAEAGLPPTGFSLRQLQQQLENHPKPLRRLAAAARGRARQCAVAAGCQRCLPRQSLRRAAAAAGVEPARLIFAPCTDPDSHLARQQLADLMLDTGPYNGHMTSSATRCGPGVPLVTLQGTAFAGRVAASWLRSGPAPNSSPNRWKNMKPWRWRWPPIPAGLLPCAAGLPPPAPVRRCPTPRQCARMSSAPFWP